VTTKRVTAAGITYNVRTVGEGRPVVLLHGFPENSASWRHNEDALVQAGYRVIAPDLKGYGGTDKPVPGAAHGDYRVSTMSVEIAELINALGYDRADIVGHDWGGVLLSAMMLTRRDVIDRAVLVNAPFKRFLPWRPRHIYFFNLPSLPERRFYRDPMGFVGGIFDYWSVQRDSCTRADLTGFVRAFQTDGSISCAFAYYRSLRRDLPFIIKAQTAGPPEGGYPPAMVVFGAGDPIMPPLVAKMAHKDLPGSRLELIEGAGHFVHSEAPERFNAALLDFLQQR